MKYRELQGNYGDIHLIKTASEADYLLNLKEEKIIELKALLRRAAVELKLYEDECKYIPTAELISKIDLAINWG